MGGLKQILGLDPQCSGLVYLPTEILGNSSAYLDLHLLRPDRGDRTQAELEEKSGQKLSRSAPAGCGSCPFEAARAVAA